MISLVLLRRLFRGHRIRLAVGLAVVVIWALLFPVIFKAFSGRAASIPGKPSSLSNFSTLAATISIGFIHPISIALYGILSAGLTVGALSGERQRGTLELLLSRPISRSKVLATMLLEGWLGASLAAAAYVLGTILGSLISGVSDQLAFEQLPTLWAYATLFWGAFATIGIAASGSFDTTAPSMAIVVSFIMANYILEVIGQFWDVVEPYRYLSLFNHFSPVDLLNKTVDGSAALIFAVVALIAAIWAFYIFPRRDLAAPN
jgi:ABC-2 type transport system permease protein